MNARYALWIYCYEEHVKSKQNNKFIDCLNALSRASQTLEVNIVTTSSQQIILGLFELRLQLAILLAAQTRNCGTRFPTAKTLARSFEQLRQVLKRTVCQQQHCTHGEGRESAQRALTKHHRCTQARRRRAARGAFTV
jgi:hypothetical protein